MHIFLSYGHDEHAPLAGRIKQDLERKEHKVWFDVERLRAGIAWDEYIEEGLRKSDCVILLMTPHSVRRPGGFCLNEIARALSLGLRVIPVMAVKCEPPITVCRLQYLDMTNCGPADQNGGRYEVKLQQLLEALKIPSLDLDGGQARLMRYLSPLSFEAEIKKHLPRFYGRRQIVERVDEWLRGTERILWLTGDAGTGKTSLVCWLAHIHPSVAAIHLCIYGDKRKSDPRACVRSIAYQLATQLPGYWETLSAQHLENPEVHSDAEASFDGLISQPLTACPHPGRQVVVLIDALDESSQGGRNDLAALLAKGFENTPPWLRLVITSRDVPEVSNRLQGTDARPLSWWAPENQKDIRGYVSRELERLAHSSRERPAAVDAISAKSEGIFLYAHWVCKEVERGKLSLAKPEEFPVGLGQVYFREFDRIFGENQAEYHRHFGPAIAILCASVEPLALDFLAAEFSWNDLQRDTLRRRLAPLFPILEGVIRPFHRSLTEWLSTTAAGAFKVDVAEGHRQLAQIAWRKYRAGSLSESSYLMAHGAKHMARAGMAKEFEVFLSDPKVIDAKCKVDMFDFAADMAAGQECGLSLESVASRCVETLAATGADETFRQRLRAALSQAFGPYSSWPEPVRNCLERSGLLRVQLFAAEVMDASGLHAESARYLLEKRKQADIHYAALCVREASVWHHLEQVEKSLNMLLDLVSQKDALDRYEDEYWWAQYHIGISYRLLKNYRDASAALRKVIDGTAGRALRVASRHQMGVIELERGDVDQAEEIFRECLEERTADPWDHRRAFEYRRLGQVYALRKNFLEATKAFSEAKAISARCGQWRYVREVEADIAEFLGDTQ